MSDFMGEENILMVTKNGNVIKIPTNDIKAIGRVTSGVKGINLKENDKVVAAFPVSHETAIITKNGKAKKVETEQFIIQCRGGRGVSGIKLDSDDYVVSALPIVLNESLLIIGKPNSICTASTEIPIQSKASAGVKIIERSIVNFVVKL